MKKVITTLTIILIGYYIAEAQIDPKLLKRSTLDTAKQSLNMDAVYERPFITVGKLPVSLGGIWKQTGNIQVQMVFPRDINFSLEE